MVSSIQASPSSDFILTSYRARYSSVFDHYVRTIENEDSFTSIYFHIYRQLDWRLYVFIGLFGDV